MSIPETVSELLEPVVATLDVELLDVEWNGNSLRVVVDRLWAEGEVPDKKNGITTSQLQDVNRLISPILDQHDPIPGRYTLEVSSPGVERKLAKPEHFARAVGEDVVVKLLPGEEPRRVRGELLAFDADDHRLTIAAVEIDGIDQPHVEPTTIAMNQIQKARTSFQWGPSPKPGGPKKKSTRAAKVTGQTSSTRAGIDQDVADDNTARESKTESKTEYEDES